MAMTYRDEKGAPLTSDEVDENFRTLQEAIDGFTGTPGVGIASITQAGDTVTFHLTDGSTQGPFDLPVASFNDTGTWQEDTDYAMLDLFTVPNDGLYLTLIGFNSGSSFDPAATDTDGNPFVKRIISTANGPQVVLSMGGDGVTLDAESYRNTYVRFDADILSTVYLVEGDGWTVGDTVTMRQIATGQILLVPDGAVTINSPESLKSRKQGSTITLIYVADNEWDLAGDLELLPEALTTTGP